MASYCICESHNRQLTSVIHSIRTLTAQSFLGEEEFRKEKRRSIHTVSRSENWIWIWIWIWWENSSCFCLLLLLVPLLVLLYSNPDEMKRNYIFNSIRLERGSVCVCVWKKASASAAKKEKKTKTKTKSSFESMMSGMNWEWGRQGSRSYVRGSLHSLSLPFPHSPFFFSPLLIDWLIDWERERDTVVCLCVWKRRQRRGKRNQEE